MDSRVWYFVNPLNNVQGPVCGAELDAVLCKHDVLVWSPGMPSWVMGSEHFASAPALPATSAEHDAHGQPPAWIHRERVSRRSFDELVGFVRGILADGEVSDREARSLLDWCRKNRAAVAEWPGREIAARLSRVFADGKVTDEERADLTVLLQAVTGGRPDLPSGSGQSTRLPLNEPAPALAFSGRSFVLTGQFVYGTRNACEAEVVQRGGRCSSSVSMKIDFARRSDPAIAFGHESLVFRMNLL